MTPKTGALIGILASHGLLGFVTAWSPLATRQGSAFVAVIMALTGFIAGYFPFAWVVHDRREHGLPRSRWFDVALVSATALVVPVYLWRSRPRGKRLIPIVGMAGVMAGAYVLAVMAMLAGFVIVALTMDFPGV